MRFTWEEQTVRWFMSASGYTGFHKALAQLILPHLEQGDTLCDLGCGLGRLDLELALHISQLTAVDLSENAIEVLRRDAEAAGLKNLRVRQDDASALTETFDVALMSFFGRSNMLELLKLCKRRLIRVVGAENKSGLYPEKYRCDERDTVPTVQKELDAKGIVYKLELHSLEFGQPLVSRQDAELYVLQNAPKAGDAEIRDFLNENLTSTGRDDFPFYLPNKKAFGIFVLDKED